MIALLSEGEPSPGDWFFVAGSLGWLRKGALGLIPTFATVEIPALISLYVSCGPWGYALRRELALISVGILGLAVTYAVIWRVVPQLR